MQNKYTVFKTSDIGEWLQEQFERADTEPLTDAVVLRQKDIFAGTALHAYSAAVHNAIEIMEGMGADVPAYLYDLRDDFAELAEGADAHKAKRLPD